jgi:prolyl-tRNA editing enzyme YbaK/EbsC (Cys-tRNA(Pro) deacylase)
VTGYAAGLVSPVLLPDDVSLYIDDAVVAELDPDSVVYTATGESGTALGVRLLDLLALRAAKSIALSAPIR